LQLGANFEAIKGAIDASKEFFSFVSKAEKEKEERENGESVRKDLQIGNI
jgi:hypothetical protein